MLNIIYRRRFYSKNAQIEAMDRRNLGVHTAIFVIDTLHTGCPKFNFLLMQLQTTKTRFFQIQCPNLFFIF